MGPRVLVVDENDVARRALAAGLREAGFVIEEARDLAEANAVFERRSLDAAVIDLMLPAVSGLLLVRQLYSRCPALPIVLTSAYRLSPEQVGRIGGNPVGLILKPAAPREVAQLVREVVSRSAGTPAGAGS